MKLLIVSTVKYRKNGISSVIDNYYSDPVFDHWDIRFLFPVGSDEAMIRELEAKGGQVYLCSRSMKRAPMYCAQVTKLVRREGFDAVHVHGNSATMALEMLGAALGGCRVRMAHSHNTTCKHMAVHKLFTPVFQKLCTHRLACGVAAGKWLYGSRDFTVVNNGVDTGRYAFDVAARAAIRQRFAIPEGAVLVGHVGSFNPQKNQSFLLDVLQLLPRETYRLLLIGDGELRPEAEQRAASMGLTDRVIFAGLVSDVSKYLCACDCIAMPSLYEGLPLTLIEQQANGLRCVISDNITREADKTGNLTFLSLVDPACWADTIQKLPAADRKELSRICGEKIAAAGYDIHREAAKLKEYYRQAVEKA